MRAFLPPITGPEAGKTSAIADGTISAKTYAPSRILRLTEYINSSGAVFYTKKPADEKNKVSEIFAECCADTWQHNVSMRGIL
jgi:hypothetical protein